MIAAQRLLPAEPINLRRQVAILTATLSAADVLPPGEDELERVQQQVLEAWRGHIDLATLPPRTLRVAPWVLWHEDFAPASDQSFVHPFSRAGEQRAGARFVRALAHTFLLSYPRALATFEEWRKAILNLVIRHANRQRRLFQAWYKWQKHNVLSRNGTQLVARELAQATDPEDLLNQAGLEGSLMQSRLVEEALTFALTDLQSALAASDVSAGRLSFLQLFSRDGALRYPSLKQKLAHAVLMPFRERDPSEEVRQTLTEFFRGLFGDPRLARQRWHGISEQAQAVMRRWLARISLEDFFRVIDATADPSHWHARKAFWTRYWEQGLISDAWVALGWTTRARLSEDSAGGYATLEGALHNHAALLLRIGKAVVLEWSHSGACRIFAPGSPEQPTLFKERYFAKELRATTPYWVRHHGQRWRETIARHLQEVAGAPPPTAPVAPHRSARRWL